MRKIFWPVLIILVVAIVSVAVYTQNKTQPRPASVSSPGAPQNYQPTSTLIQTNMQITSPAFVDNQSIPELYTCEGKSISVPLQFADVPPEAKSLSLIMDDPDVPASLLPSGLFVHWVVYNISPTTTAFAENQEPPGVQGNNSAGNRSYAAPCPPDREHRYFFKLYALDSMLNFPAGATKDQVETAMQGHILRQAQLIGRYNKKANRSTP